MEYKKYEYDNYTVHFFKTDKFKSIYVSMILLNEFTKESLTKNALLRRLLTGSSKNYKNETEVVRKVYSLYNSGLYIENSFHNNVVSTDFSIEFLEDKYSEDGLFRKALDYYFDTIFNPNVIDGKFESKNFELAKKSLENYYARKKEDKNSYAFDRACELLDEEYLRYPINGYRECLDSLNEKNMYEYYNQLFKTANTNIFAIGSFDDEKMLDIINKNVNGRLYKNTNKYVKNNFDEVKEIKERVEKEENNQSKLVMIYKLTNITDRERNVILPVFNRILGVGSNSKLFKNVREKKSLAYDVRSSSNRDDSLLSVFAGIDKDKKDETVNAIKDEFKNMQDGKFADNDLKDAILSRKRILTQFLDENDSTLYCNISHILYDNDDFEERIEKLNGITKKEITSLAQKAKLCIVYMLEGDKNE